MPAHCTVIAMRLLVGPPQAPGSDYHSVEYRVPRGRSQDISVLVQEGGQPLVLPALTALQRELQATGVCCLWTSDVLPRGACRE